MEGLFLKDGTLSPCSSIVNQTKIYYDTGNTCGLGVTIRKDWLFWSVHLGVRIQDFHSCHTGSNPVPTTKVVRTTYHTSCTYMVLKCELGD